jgi:flagellin-like hook-associated protein FlgL
MLDTTTTSAETAALYAANDPTGAGRNALGLELDQMAESIIQSMNAKYGDNFVFSGSDGETVPFTWDEDGNLLYRGVNVSEISQVGDQPATVTFKSNGAYSTAAELGNATIDGTPLSELFTASYADDGTTIDLTSATTLDPTRDIVLKANEGGTLTDAQIADLEGLNDTPTTVTFTIGTDNNYANAAEIGEKTIDGTSLSQMYTAKVTHTDGSTETIDLTDDTITLATNDQITLTAIERGSSDTIKVQNNTLSKMFNGTVTSGVDNSASVTVVDGTMKDSAEYLKLKAMSDEKNFVDIGIGMEEDEDGKLIQSSAFNDNLQGINFLGYGVDEDGDPKNIAVIIKQMSQCLARCDENGSWTGDDGETFNRLLGKLEDASSELKSQYAQLDAKASFLETQSDQLEKSADILNEEFLEIEQCDLADAITSYSWAQYCYNAALKVGNSILSQSLIDYLD